MMLGALIVCTTISILSVMLALNALRGAASSISREREACRQEVDRAWTIARAETTKRVVSQELIIEIMQSYKSESLTMSNGLKFLVIGTRGKPQEEKTMFLLKGVPHVVNELAKQARRPDAS